MDAGLVLAWRNSGSVITLKSWHRLGVLTPPSQWVDLANERLFNAIAMADPTKSGSVAKAFELMIQQQMNQRLTELAASEGDQSREQRERQAVTEGWERGLAAPDSSRGKFPLFQRCRSESPDGCRLR